MAESELKGQIKAVAFTVLVVTTLLWGVAAILRGQHSPGHDELNFVETGLRMLGTKGNPGEFLTKQKDAQTGAGTGRLFRGTASLAAESDRPRYDLVQRRITEVSNLDRFDYVVLSYFNSLPGEWWFNVKASDSKVIQAVS